jgi:hypothetical protein
MSEQERLETLDQLMKAKESAMNDYNRLPIASNTNGIRRRREDIEDKLQEIESAIKTFTRPKVYVAV